MKNSALPSLFVLAALFAVSGCAVENDHTEFKGIGFGYHSDVKKLEDGNYYLEAEASPGSGRISGASGSAYKEATKYCEIMGKSMKVVKEETDSHLIVNGVSRLTFSCL